MQQAPSTGQSHSQQSLNLRYLKESVSQLDQLLKQQAKSAADHTSLKAALSEIDLELAILKSTVEYPR